MRLLPLCVLLTAAAPAARGGVTLVGVGTLPGTAADRSGLTGAAADGTPLDRLGGLGSAVDYAGAGDEYVLASDRGPKDGTVDFPCRVHRMTIRVTPGAKEPVALALTATTLLADEAGRPFTGALAAFTGPRPDRNRRLDPEGVRVGRNGRLFVADEYGPAVVEFGPDGRRVRSLPVPDRFVAPRPGKTPADELPPAARSGRQPNRGMEGLALSADGTKLLGAMQSPLIQDGALGPDNARVGVNCRLLEIDLATAATREFVYPLDDPANGVCEVVAAGDGTYLVLERDGLGGKAAACKKVYRVDPGRATDVSGVAALPAGRLPADLKPVTKTPFLDLLDPRHGIAGEGCPEKFEGLAFGPTLPDGRRLLLVTADNDFVAEQPLRVYAFAVDPADLPGLAPARR